MLSDRPLAGCRCGAPPPAEDAGKAITWGTELCKSVLVKEAHEQICPYSHATRNNAAVDFVVKGA